MTRSNRSTKHRDLQAKIRLGKDSHLELKEVRFAGSKVCGPECNDLADEIAPFANTRGGELVLGVSDESCDVTGIPIEQLDTVERLVLQACEDSINPSLFVVITRLNLSSHAGVEKPVIAVEIPRSLFVHLSPGGYFQRIGSSKRPISPDQLARLFQQRTQARLIRFDETPVYNATLEDLDKTLWQRFTTAKSTDIPERMLSKLAMVSTDDTNTWRPTIAGVLIASRQPQQFIPDAFVQAVAYQGKSISPQTGMVYQLDAQDIVGPLDQQIFDTCNFVRKNMRVLATKSAQGGREDLPQFDMLAVFEAVTNAVAHRDYSMAGSKVRLRIFDDRLELYTPGQLMNTMTTESLPFRQATRNEAVSSLLARCPMNRDDLKGFRSRIMDKRGEGVPIILSRSEQLSGKVPEFRMTDDSELMLTIYAADHT